MVYTEQLEINGYSIDLFGRHRQLPQAYMRAVGTHQVHSCFVTTLSGYTESRLQVAADGILTRRDTGTMLRVFGSDCPILTLLGREYFATVHAGWKGLKKEILPLTVKKMCRQGEQVFDIHVFVGPSICGASYEVGEEFYGYFNKKYLFSQGSSLYFDMRKLILDQLLISGVARSHIHYHTDCTYVYNSKRSSRRKGDRGIHNFMCVTPLTLPSVSTND